ncbi:MAG: nucleotidyltransferase domain-containing protein [Candidatus Aenigmarchaeota archaeon]|nr:nucleotidyltransferase domain-containing protein [Candidatus Aenigmarchaeota archaeon]
MISRTKLVQLKGFLKKQKYIKLVYLFGSSARNEEGPLSDIDIAVFLDKKLSKLQRHQKHLFLIKEFIEQDYTIRSAVERNFQLASTRDSRYLPELNFPCL